MEPKGSSLCSQKSVTGHYTEHLCKVQGLASTWDMQIDLFHWRLLVRMYTYMVSSMHAATAHCQFNHSNETCYMNENSIVNSTQMTEY